MNTGDAIKVQLGSTAKDSAVWVNGKKIDNVRSVTLGCDASTPSITEICLVLQAPSGDRTTVHYGYFVSHRDMQAFELWVKERDA